MRMVSQGLVTGGWLGSTRTPLEAVRHAVALQGQDLPAVLRAIAARSTPGTTLDDVRAAFDDGLVRSWAMRGTLFVAAADDLAVLHAWTAERMRRQEWRMCEVRGIDQAVRGVVGEGHGAHLEPDDAVHGAGHDFDVRGGDRGGECGGLDAEGSHQGVVHGLEHGVGVVVLVQGPGGLDRERRVGSGDRRSAAAVNWWQRPHRTGRVQCHTATTNPRRSWCQ